MEVFVEEVTSYQEGLAAFGFEQGKNILQRIVSLRVVFPGCEV